MQQINIGIPEKNRETIARSLSKLLADNYTLYLKTQGFHWNVTGSMFQTLHVMFEQQYNELILSNDSIAERIRSLGFPAPASFHSFLKLTSIKEAETVPSAKQMIRELLEGHETTARTARSAVPEAEEGQDEATLDLLTQRIEIHEKTAWMLRSLLEE